MMERIVTILIILAIGWGLRDCTMADRANKADSVVERDTVWVHDTVAVREPLAVRSEGLGVRRYKLAVRSEELGVELGLEGEKGEKAINELGVRSEGLGVDSVEVELPIEQKEYGDSTYRAWVSGFDARLDSIYIYQPIRYITITTTKEPSRWSWGIQAGMGITPKGVQPYLGLGVQWRF